MIFWESVLRAISKDGAGRASRASMPGCEVSDQALSTGLWLNCHCSPSSEAEKSSDDAGREAEERTLRRTFGLTHSATGSPTPLPS